MSAKKKILFLLHIPPPVHGSSMVGKYIKEGEKINLVFDTSYINIGTSKSIDDIGKKPFLKIVGYLNIIVQTIKQLIFFKPNLVYFAVTAKGIGFYKDVIIALIVKLFGVQMVFHFHNKGVSANQHKRIDNFLYRLIFKNAKIILLSKSLYLDVKKYVKECNLYYCPNGIPEVKGFVLSKRSENKKVQLLFLSNLIESKGVYVLLEALKIVEKSGLNFKCNFVGGEGDIDRDKFENKVKSLSLEKHVCFLGKKFNDEKHKIFYQSDVFVFPTFYHNETFGLVNIEAMMFKLPVISTFEGGIPDVVDNNRTGFLVDQKDVCALATKITVLIKNEKLRLKMGQAGYLKYKEKYTLVKFENQLFSILTQILKT